MLFLPYGTLQEVSKLKDCIPDRQFVSILKDFRKALGSVRVSKLLGQVSLKNVISMSLAWLNKSKKKCNTMKSLKHATFSPACEQTHKWTGLKALFRPVATKSATK